MATTPTTLLDHLVDQLVRRHDLTRRAATAVLDRAARRKGLSLDALVMRILHGGLAAG